MLWHLQESIKDFRFSAFYLAAAPTINIASWHKAPLRWSMLGMAGTAGSSDEDFFGGGSRARRRPLTRNRSELH